MLHLYDTAARAKVALSTRDAGHVRMYVCGPTVQDVPHLGHGRTALTFDVARRYMEWRGYQVTHVSNVTDVEDKIIAKARAEGLTEPEIAERSETIHREQLERLGVLPPHEVPHATDYIEQMLNLIGDLVEMGHAYAVPGSGVYFEVPSYLEYGSLSGRTIELLMESAGARVEIDDAKRSPLDFALWKAVKSDEPSWDSPWGRGRPGWHIECSAMALDLLGEGFDIHGGGSDLTFPHHENEIAQAEAGGHRFARHWMHSAMLNIKGEKMSKSLNNFLTLADSIDIHGPRALRLWMLQTHYRTQLDVAEDALTAAKAALDGLDALARRARVAGIEPTVELERADIDAFRSAMDDDFNTPQALAALFDCARRANAAIDRGDPEAAKLLATANDLAGALGLSFDDGSAARDDADAGEIESLIEARAAARADRNFAEADRIRDELIAMGVHIEDSPTGTTWHR